ncbi:MAG: hypothetical protein ACFFD1_14000, partial [Candidatus Thorarchaeota archaeon]
INGITLQQSNNSIIRYNSIIENSNLGCGITWSENNEISLNTISLNTIWNARDYGGANIWIRNSYGDYIGYGYYNISGTSGTVDKSPYIVDTDGDGMADWFEIKYGLNLMSNDSMLDPDGDGLTNLQEYLLGTNPLISNNNPDITATYINDSITWNAQSVNASSYTIYQNNTIKASGAWVSGVNISLSVKGLLPGTYNFTIILQDDYGRITTQEIIITVPSPIEPKTITVTGSTNTTNTVMETSIKTITSQAIETLTKTAQGFGVTIVVISFLGLIVMRRKRKQ